MYALGHLGLSVACYAPVLLYRRFDRRSVAGLGCVAGLATVPDVDQYVAALPHRGLTHTVWFALGVGLALGVAFALAAPDGRNRLGYGVDGARAGVVTVLAHLLGDAATPLGVRPLVPVYGGERLSLALVSARDPTANRALFWFGVAVLVAATLVDPGRRRRIRDVVRTPPDVGKDA